LNVTDEKLMTVGEIAKEADVSVRTLQYYDKCGLLKPSAYSEGGNRLYSSKDLVMLHQAKGLKHLGLSLDEIKRQLISLDAPKKVLEILKRQKEIITGNINGLKTTLSAIELLENEILKNNSVNFEKYARIISIIHAARDNLWFMNIMEQDLREHVIHKLGKESSGDVYDNMTNWLDAAIQAQESGVLPESPKGQELASSLWSMTEDFTDGNSSLYPSLINFSGKLTGFTNEFSIKWKQVEPFIGEALEIYLKNNQINFPNET